MTDENGYNLAGAKFTINGYEVTGSNGEYKITRLKDGESIEMECDADGKLVIIGLAHNNDAETPAPITYHITESTAPEGYNLKVGAIDVEATKTTTTTTKVHYDENGEEVNRETSFVKTPEDEVSISVINERGALLPSTGGIGTTIFYVVGGILVAAAGVLLITKKRMSGRS